MAGLTDLIEPIYVTSMSFGGTLYSTHPPMTCREVTLDKDGNIARINLRLNDWYCRQVRTNLAARLYDYLRKLF